MLLWKITNKKIRTLYKYKMKVLSFDVLPSLRSSAERCSVEQFNEIVDSPMVKEITQSIAKDYEQWVSGNLTDEEFRERKSQKKKGLPAFTFQAHFADGKRHNESAEPSNLAIFDVDNCESREMAEQLQKESQAKLQEMGMLESCIALMHTTPSGRGYRIVFRMPEGLTIPQSQRWLASKLGIEEFDTTCKDNARLSFAVPRDYFTYLNEGLLFAESIRPLEVPDDELAPFREEPQVKAPEPTEAAEVKTENAAIPAGWKAGFPEGVSLADILPHYWSNVGGEPGVGERNAKLFSLAKDSAVYFEFNEEAMFQQLPSYGLDETEMRNLIHSACGYRNYLSSKNFKKAMRMAEVQHEAQQQEGNPVPQMPKRLPSLIWHLTKETPKIYKHVVAIAVFPSLASHLWRVYFPYTDNVWHEATLMNVLVGPYSHGKSSIVKPIECNMEDIVARDKANFQERKAWEKMSKNSTVFDEIPAKPIYFVQKIMPNCTSAVFNEFGENAEGRFLYTCANEIGLLNGLQGIDGKSGAYELIKAAFDTADWGQHRVSEDAVNAMYKLHFNFNASATKGKAKRYFKNALTDGTVSRLTFTLLERQPIGAEQPKYGKYDDAFRAKLKPYIDNLNQTRGEIVCKEALALARSISDTIKCRAILSQDEVYDDLSHRAVLIGYLMACVLYVANGMKWEKEIEPFIRWAVDYDLYSKMTLFGDAIRREQQQDACTYQPVNLYDSLNATFTYEDFLQARQKLNMGTDEKKANDLLRQWVSRQKIKRCDSVTSDSVQRFEKIA